MSGHSKWANIKHKKEASDKKKGKIFSRIAKEIMVCVKQSGKDPGSNPRLRMALIEARAANMPRDNIDRAIKRAAANSATSIMKRSSMKATARRGPPSSWNA